jgi:hypothetical protein
MVRMDVSEEQIRAVLPEPSGHRHGGLAGVALPLVPGGDHPGHLRGHSAGPPHRGLHRAHGGARVAVAHDPVQPSLLAIGGSPGNLPLGPVAQLLNGQRVTADVGVQGLVVQQRSHLGGMIDPQRLQDEPCRLDHFGHRPVALRPHSAHPRTRVTSLTNRYRNGMIKARWVMAGRHPVERCRGGHR